MYFTPDRLLLIALVITLVSVDGMRHAWKQRQDGTIGDRLYYGYAAALGLGSTLTWVGFLARWL